MTDSTILETRDIASAQKQTEQQEVNRLWASLAAKATEIGLAGKELDKLKQAFSLVDADSSQNGERGKRKNGDLELSHPVIVTLKVIETIKRHPDKIGKDVEVLMAALFHDYFEDVPHAVAALNLLFAGDQQTIAKVMGWALDVTKVEMLPREASDMTISQDLLAKTLGVSVVDYTDEGQLKKTRKANSNLLICLLA